MASKNEPASPDRMTELLELRRSLWLLAQDSETPRAVQVQALRELRAVSQDIAAMSPATSSTVQKLATLRLKAVKGGKA